MKVSVSRTMPAPPEAVWEVVADPHNHVRTLPASVSQIEVDESGEYPWDNFEALKSMEVPALGIPVEYGGAGADHVTQSIMVEELSRVCASTSLIALISKLGMIPVMNWIPWKSAIALPNCRRSFA